MGRSRVSKATLAPAQAPQGRSTQPSDEDPYTPNEAITPPEDLERLAKLTQVSRTRRSCIAAITLNTVGRGVTLSPRDGAAEDINDERLVEVRQQLDALARRDVRTHRPDFVRLVTMAKWDEQEVGNGYIEVSRNRVTGQVDGLFHLPGKRLRRLRTRDGWILGPRARSSAAEERIRFYDFGQKVAYDNDGRPTSRLARNGLRWDVNEVIPLQLYTSESADYGLPPDAQLGYDYAGDTLAAQTNLGYFDSSGVPPTMIFVQGKEADAADGDDDELTFEVDPLLGQSLADALLAGGDRRRRVVVVPVPPGTSVDKVELAQLSDRDMGFVEFRKDNRRATLGAYRLAPIFVADIEDTNYSTAEIEMRVTKEQVFDPEQERTAAILNETLVRELEPGGVLDFEEMPTEIPEAARAAADAAADRGTMTNGEYREAHRLAPLPEGTPEEIEAGKAAVPKGWAQQLVKAPQAGGPRDVPEQLAKGDPADPEGALLAELADDFDRQLASAIDSLGIDARLRPTVVERDGDSITIRQPAEA